KYIFTNNIDTYHWDYDGIYKYTRHNKDNYHKACYRIKAQNKGYISVMLQSKGETRIYISDKNMKKISNYAYLNENGKEYDSGYFAVDKNETYYINIETSSEKKIKSISYKYERINDMGGINRDNATELTEGDNTGIITAGTENSRWYKHILTEKDICYLQGEIDEEDDASCFYDMGYCFTKNSGSFTVNYYLNNTLIDSDITAWTGGRLGIYMSYHDIKDINIGDLLYIEVTNKTVSKEYNVDNTKSSSGYLCINTDSSDMERLR
ncbi:MAG: hypothetical protein K2N51_11230, partial [Lachnospiraceae bacterium]|nr:hypothetical protein [Lachnospiraceae bacterium]